MKTSFLIFGLVVAFLNFSCNKEEAKLCNAAPVVKAGDDITLYNTTSAVLEGTTDASTGTWSIVSGTGGNISVVDNVANFSGLPNNTYELKFESTNQCGVSSDITNVSLETVDAGSDKTIDQMVDNITWIDQSGFKIQGSKFKIYIDPVSVPKGDDADIILITHPHGDHFSPTSVDVLTSAKTFIIAPSDCKYIGTFNKRIVLKPGEETIVKGCVKIKAVPAYNISKSYHPRSNDWVGYLITINGVTIYHAGDTERIPELKNYACDIALIPMGQTYTMNSVSDAAESAKDVKAKVAIPMHYGTAEGNANDAKTFKSLLSGLINVVIKTKAK